MFKLPKHTRPVPKIDCDKNYNCDTRYLSTRLFRKKENPLSLPAAQCLDKYYLQKRKHIQEPYVELYQDQGLFLFEIQTAPGRFK